MFGVDRAPFLDRGDDRREVVVGEHHVGRLLRHVGAGDAHRDADVGGLERRRVVDAVAGHRDDLAAAPAARARCAACARGDARVDTARRATRARSAVVVQRVELGAGHRAASSAPRCRARARWRAAVRGWSPVIISTRTPAACAARPPSRPRRAAGRSCRRRPARPAPARAPGAAPRRRPRSVSAAGERPACAAPRRPARRCVPGSRRGAPASSGRRRRRRARACSARAARPARPW